MTIDQKPDGELRNALREFDLIYTTDRQPGYHRRRRGRGFSFHDSTGKLLRDQEEIRRIKSLAIPPAYQDVWICPDPRGHLQATGVDDRGRKQYLYHPRWQQVRDANKFRDLLVFAENLPRLRQRVRKDMRQPGFPREKVAALVIRLLEVTLIRVGNRRYAQQNKSYGLTTLRMRHVAVNGREVLFRFRGKRGKWHEVSLRDRRLALEVRKCGDIRGQELFQYEDENGEVHALTSSHVNDYLHEITGADVSAKDFRTWAATVAMFQILRRNGPCETVTECKRMIAAAVKEVAQQLRNTPSICRTSYIHPAIIEAYHAGDFSRLDDSRVEKKLVREYPGLRASERRTVYLLKRRISAKAEKSKAKLS